MGSYLIVVILEGRDGGTTIIYIGVVVILLNQYPEVSLETCKVRESSNESLARESIFHKTCLWRKIQLYKYIN